MSNYHNEYEEDKNDAINLRTIKFIYPRRTKQFLFIICLISELLPPKEGPPALFTDLQPPPLPTDLEQRTAILFVVNIVGIKNMTGEESNEILHDDILEEAYPVIGKYIFNIFETRALTRLETAIEMQTPY